MLVKLKISVQSIGPTDTGVMDLLLCFTIYLFILFSGSLSCDPIIVTAFFLTDACIAALLCYCFF